jgi:hypothetical protein
MNPKDTTYKNYGALGTKVCKDWVEDRNSFFVWASDNGYDDTLSIDRIDGFGDYEPNNCRWVNKTIQSRNMPRQRKGVTGVRGVSIARQWVGEYYRATITIDNKSKTIGYAKTISEAAILRNNFIDENNLTHIKSEVHNAPQM